MKKILFVLIVAGISVSFTVPVKKISSEKTEEINMNRLMIGFKID